MKQPLSPKAVQKDVTHPFSGKDRRQCISELLAQIFMRHERALSEKTAIRLENSPSLSVNHGVLTDGDGE